MTQVVESIVLPLAIGCVLLVFAVGANTLRRNIRGLLLPMVVREKWSAEDHEYWSDRHRETEEPKVGSLVWQMHEELERLTANAASMVVKRKAWQDELELLGEKCAHGTERARAAIGHGREAEARQILGERQLLEERQAGIRGDIERLDGLLAVARRDIAELETRIGNDFRRSSVADTRLATARNSIRARQLVHGTLGEAAMAWVERTEREADLAEGTAEALNLGNDTYLDREFAKLEQEAVLERELHAKR